MDYQQTKVSGTGLEKWLDQHIAHRCRVEFITGCFTLLFAFAASVLAMALLLRGVGPFSEALWLVPLGLVLIFVSYPFVTPKPLPLFGWMRERHEQDPLRQAVEHPFAVRYYFWEGYMALGALYWAPVFFHIAVEEFRRALAVRMLDRNIVLCAIRMLAERESRVPWHEFEDSFPMVPIAAIQRNLSLVEGVVFLKNEPTGATLTDSLREEIRAAL